MTKNELIEKLASRFLMWPLPKTVASDLCATDSRYQFHRSGTNLLNADEAREMVAYLLGGLESILDGEESSAGKRLIGAAREMREMARERNYWEEIRQAVAYSAWKHEGDDLFSRGMDAGARHQIKATMEAIDALASVASTPKEQNNGDH